MQGALEDSIPHGRAQNSAARADCGGRLAIARAKQHTTGALKPLAVAQPVGCQWPGAPKLELDASMPSLVNCFLWRVPRFSPAAQAGQHGTRVGEQPASTLRSRDPARVGDPTAHGARVATLSV